MSVKDFKLTNGMTDEAKNAFNLKFSNCRDVRDRVTDLVDKSVDKLLEELLGNKSFETPAYSEKQAYLMGQINERRWFIKLLSENK